jgi:putative peptidoglycan lipid II flippase
MISKHEKKPGAASTRTGWHAFLVAAGIFLSRIAGLIRERAFAHYFGNSDAADAFRAAFRIPNFLQNLFGEGVISASFIPVYANLHGRGKDEEAGQVAGAIASLLVLTTSVIVLAGVLATPWLIHAIAPGFEGEKRELCILLVRILFPGAGFLVWSAWCLGILNSHGRFFLSYAAPVIWNAVIITAIIFFGGRTGQNDLAKWTAWGSVAGSLAQIAIQLPAVLGLIKRLRLSLNYRASGVTTVIKNFVPVFIGRGVIQISAYVDQILASFLGTGAVAGLGYAQTLYTLPVSLFGMSVSAAELPAMSKASGSTAEISEYLRKQLNSGLRRIAFFIVPSAAGFLALGDIAAGAVYQTGCFTSADSVYVWAILAGSSIGLLASTLGRLYSSGFYALQDTRTPLRFALFRVALSTGLGYALSQHGPALLGIDLRWGAAGITSASGFCGWIEFLLLRRALNGRIGKTGLKLSYVAKLWLAALTGAAFAWLIKGYTLQLHPVITAALVLGPYGIIYFTLTYAMKIPESRFLDRIIGLLKKIIPGADSK